MHANIHQSLNLAPEIIGGLYVLSFITLLNFAFSAIKGIPENDDY
jgi:hypothetical protein